MSEYIDEDLTKKENVLDIIVSRLESQKERALFLIKDMLNDKKVLKGGDYLIESYIQVISEIDSKLNVIRTNRWWLTKND
tara:strand:- start:187 stop:426 length:240 start_codon:yes stop_codon:yes gene_type:complete